MKKMTSTEIRNMWFKFFESKGHKILESAPLVPIDDDSLLFINAGVTPLKKYFDGTVVPDNKRLASIQKCIRTNDIDNVGVTKRHQTFFEMMGNFSVGDYFRDDALTFAMELLTGEDWFAIPKEKIYVTVYTDDEAAFNKWVSLGLDPSHIARLDGNFWEIGEGPCGPDSEIFYDRGSEYDPDGKALEHFMKDEEQERYVEIWNNVFSQFNSKTGLDRKDYPELPNKNIDTGAGLERWCCIFQGVDSTFETDLFVPIIERIEELTNRKYNGEMPYKVIADHIRAITMALTDGAIFENTGRGYVLRRLLRRSVRMGKKLGMNEPFIYKLVDTVADIMKDSYKDVETSKGFVKTLVLQEEELFYKTLEQGERRLYQLISESKDKTISGYDAFKLYDTYGFPFELTLEYLEEQGLTTSREEFDKYMTEARQLAKSNQKDNANMHIQNEVLLSFKDNSEFLYDTYEMDSNIIALFKDDNMVDSISDTGYVVLDKTCFYATSGGQVSDIGAIKSNNFKAKVVDVIKAPNGQNLHKVEVVEGTITNGPCHIGIMEERRKKIARNHSSVHILQKSLQDVLSSNIHQAGSYVDDERLRFDFTFTGKILEHDILEVERLCNEKIQMNSDVLIREMPLEEAKKLGAMALFSEKYKDIVRVVTIGDSIELCGGTHVKNTSDIKDLAIIKLESKGSNVYRIEAATNDNITSAIAEVVKKYVEEIKKLLDKAKNILENATKEGIELKFDVILDQSGLNSYQDIIANKNQLEHVQVEVKELEKQYNEAKLNKASSDITEFLNKVEEINGKKVVITRVDNYDMDILKGIVDNIMNNIKTGLVFIANVKGNNVNFVCSSNIDTHAGLLVKNASVKSLGNGGGSNSFAQGGGKTLEFLDEIFAYVKEEIK